MTPTLSPEVLQQVTEASSSGIEPAVIASLITGGVAITVAVIGNLWSWYIARKTLADSQEFERKRLDKLMKDERERQKDELAEKRADRLFLARREIASQCLKAIQRYKYPSENVSINEAGFQLAETFQGLLGEIELLFTKDVLEEAHKLLWLGEIRSLSNSDKIYSPTHLSELDKKIEKDLKFENEKFSSFIEALSKELGTHEEPRRTHDTISRTYTTSYHHGERWKQ